MTTTLQGTLVCTKSNDFTDSYKAETDTYRTVITEFLRRAKIPLQALQPASRDDVEAAALEHITLWENKGLAATRWKPYLEASLANGTITYSHTRLDVQVHITLFTALAIAIDEFEVSDEALEGFTARLLSRAPQMDALLDCLVDNLLHMSDYFPSYACQRITLSTMEFIDATLQDKAFVDIDLRPNALPYINDKRRRSGLGAGFGFFIWDKFSFPDISTYVQVIPEAALYLCFANDILSFHKEQVAGEKGNYIHSRATVTQKDVNDVLKEVVEEVAEALERARSVLTGDKEKEAWDNFVMGYAAFHCATSRYRLAELLRNDAVLC